MPAALAGRSCHSSLSARSTPISSTMLSMAVRPLCMMPAAMWQLSSGRTGGEPWPSCAHQEPHRACLVPPLQSLLLPLHGLLPLLLLLLHGILFLLLCCFRAFLIAASLLHACACAGLLSRVSHLGSCSRRGLCTTQCSMQGEASGLCGSVCSIAPTGMHDFHTCLLMPCVQAQRCHEWWCWGGALVVSIQLCAWHPYSGHRTSGHRWQRL